MVDRTDDLELASSPGRSLELCRDLVNERGWDLLEITEGRLVARRPGTFSKKPVKVEIELSPAASGGTHAAVRAATRALVATPGGVTRETIRSICDDLAYRDKRVSSS